MIKSVLLYLVLVGLPLAGLLSILDVGQELSAPPPVAGHWQLERPLVIEGCSLAERQVITVQQSGQFLQLALGEARGEARIEAERVHGRLVGESEACSELELDGSFAEQRLTGRLARPGCADCSAIEFVAERVEERG